jgi:hypothetical protein
MDFQDHLDSYLAAKRQQRTEVFADAASTSILMLGVKFLCQHFYHLFDLYCRWYMSLAFRLKAPSAVETIKNPPGNLCSEAIETQSQPPRAPGLAAEQLAKVTGKLYADAIDTYHVFWVIVTFALYLIGWFLYDGKPETAMPHEMEDQYSAAAHIEWWLCIIPVAMCVYRIFEIIAALVEIYFRPSDTKHHQFRILIHASLHYLAAGFAFALFYVFADWSFDSFNSTNDAGKTDYQFGDWSEPIYYSLMTIVAFSGNDEPQNWQGKWLNLTELSIGFMLVTFIFMNITQIWTGSRSESE